MLTFGAVPGCGMATRSAIPRRLRAAVPELAAAPCVSAPPFVAGVAAGCTAGGAQGPEPWRA
jgi:hypothetical protein